MMTVEVTVSEVEGGGLGEEVGPGTEERCR